MRGPGVHKNIYDGGTKLWLILRVGFISSHFTVSYLFPVNPRAITGAPKMNLQLVVKSPHALIIKPRLVHVVHMYDLCTWMTWMNVQSAETYGRLQCQQDCQRNKCCIREDPVFHHKLYSNYLCVAGKLSYCNITNM